MKYFKIIKTWQMSKRQLLELDQLLQKLPGPEKNIEDRIVWLQNLISWLHKPGYVVFGNNNFSSKKQKNRLKELLLKLNKNSNINERFWKMLSSVLMEADAVYLLSAIGLADQDSIFLDLSKRINFKILPLAPDYNNLAFLIRSSFSNVSDYLWLSEMPSNFKSIIYKSIIKNSENLDMHFRQQAVESIYLLCSQSSGMALQNELRTRMRPHKLNENPFFQMETLSRQLLICSSNEEFAVLVKNLETTCKVARDYLRDVPIYLKIYGVDINIVFKIEKLEGQFTRILQILSLLGRDKVTPDIFFNLLEQLIVESIRRRSIFAFVRDRLTLLSRRITERSAETGEHYIARNIKDFFFLFKKAFGGGVITAFTVLIKFFCTHLPVSSFSYGIAASLNYSISFLGIHFLGYTLATKQPAMTAPTLAEKMHYINEKDSLMSVCDELIHLLRSQMIAVLGNVLAVVTVTALLFTLYFFSFRSSFISDEKAIHTISSLTIFGMTPIYAIFTGFLLFSSSLIAGWFDNWFVYHQLEDSMIANTRLQLIFGKKGVVKLAKFMKQNIIGITSNISLGFMLGFTPVIGALLSLPLDVRHVTLSSGALTASVCQLGFETIKLKTFWFAILGLILMAILNLGVSFSLALLLAIRAKKVTMPIRKEIFIELFKRFKKNPLIFFIPPKN